MKSKKVDVKLISDNLRERCPFILFALLTGLGDDGQAKLNEHLELSVFIGSGTATWHALEQILPVISTVVPEPCCDVTMLNRVDVLTRFRAVNGVCLFIREGREQYYRRFVQHVTLDYRVIRAQNRKLGIIEND
ncbi:MAG: hypothetical protein Q8M08_16410 [Bacteroidales bacterium]|nr:hypothetical protein [Bacteroidales bacterium]